MTTELEKTQLEIARLQLAQARRRQQVVDGLGRGASAAGGALWTAARTAVGAAIGATVGAAVGAVTPGIAFALDGKIAECARMYPAGDTLYHLGCAYGSHEEFVILYAMAATGIGVACGAYMAFRSRAHSR